MSQIIKPGTGGGGGGGVINTIAGDSGSITGANVTIFANRATNNSGASVGFDNSGTISTLNLSDSASDNTFLGQESGNSAALITSSGNSAFGIQSLQVITTSSGNTVGGGFALGRLEGGDGLNTSVGINSGQNLISGTNNTFLGSFAGMSYTSGESNNICINNYGVGAENGAIRIGTTGDQSTAFIAGISGVTVSNPTNVVIDPATGQLGQGSAVTYFKAYLSAPQNFAAGSTADSVIFDNVITNVGAGYNPATGIFTAPSTGFYSFCTTLFFTDLDVLAGNTQSLVGFTGSVESLRLINEGIGAYSMTSDIIFSAPWTMQMTVGDQVKVQPFADGTGTYQIFGGALSNTAFNTSSTFSGYRVA